jgi:hypothetical protein
LLHTVNFDIVIFHQSVTAPWTEQGFIKKLEMFKKIDFSRSIKVAFFQDEFFRTNLLCRFINELDIDYVFSVAAESEWPKIYDEVNFDRVKFQQVLTGYIDEETVREVVHLERRTQRNIDIGYRTVWDSPYRLGKFGMLKVQIAEVFARNAPQKGLTVDISTKREDILMGQEWYRFLLGCKYTIGVLSGASLLDRDGSIAAKIKEYLVGHPEADFAEVEAHCFPQLDGNLHLTAISPRHLEASLTKTCQVLVEGDYDGLFEPGIHYIELKQDYSNLEQVLDTLKQDNLRETMVTNAYNDIVLSGKYTYRAFVELVLQTVSQNQTSTAITKWEKFVYGESLLWDKVSWFFAFLFSHLFVPVYNTVQKKRWTERT